MYGRQPQLPIDVTLGLTHKSITVPTSSKYIQLRDCIRWAHRKPDLFQEKSWHHKCNYDKCSKAVSLMMGDTVLVHVTAFKGRHKIQSRWENRQYVVEWQLYPNLPIYVVCPIDGEGHSHTLHWNFPLPISYNLEQENVTMLWREVVVMNPLQCHMQRMCYWSTDWLKADQRAHLTHHQSSTNQLTQDQLGQPAQIPWLKGSKLSMACLLY